MKPSTRSIYMRDWTKFKAICLNDSGETTKTDLELARKKLNGMFPKPCRYEKVKPKKKVAMKPKTKPVMTEKKGGGKAGRPAGKTWNEFFY